MRINVIRAIFGEQCSNIMHSLWMFVRKRCVCDAVGKWGDYVWAAQKDYVLKKCSGQPRGGLSFQEPPLGCPEHFGALPTKGLACNTYLLSSPPSGGGKEAKMTRPLANLRFFPPFPPRGGGPFFPLLAPSKQKPASPLTTASDHIGRCSKATRHTRNTAMDDSIGGS